jgi:Protein phosphatase 2C
VWRRIAQSSQGSSHSADNSPCQDSHTVCVLGEGDAETLVACVADGAGSAKFSDVGSALLCQTIVDSAKAFFDLGGRLEDLTRNDVLRWCAVARIRIKRAARSRYSDPRQMAATLVAAVITPSCACFFQIGDGAIILRRNGVYGVVFWPQTGEYANSTNFITSANYRKQLDFVLTDAGFSDIAVMTDGLERLALKFDTQTPHPPFFDPFFRTLRAAEDYTGLNDALQKFLTSDSVRERSDDDKTLILASRIAGGSDQAG